MTSWDSSALTSSCFYKEVQAIPLLQSIGHLYTSTKGSSRVLNTGLAVVEYSVSSIWCRILAGSRIAAHVDSMAGEGMSKLKEKYPSLIQTTSEEIRSRASQTMKLTVRGAMKTGPGQVFLHGLDWVLDTSDGILKHVRPQEKAPRKCKLTTRSSLQKDVLLATKETSYASEDSGACDGDGESVKVHKSQQTMPPVKDKKPWSGCIMNKAYIMGIFFPLEFLVQVLKSVRRYAAGRRHKPAFRSPITPEKEVEIGSRRKVSPRKKVTSSFLGIIKDRTYRILGYKHVRAVDLGSAHDGTSPDREDTENKRKHDEILTDDGSSTDENLANFDLDDYDSAEDPDYEPVSAEESEDSISDGEAESDVETEVIKKDPVVLIQLKEKPIEATLPLKQEPKIDSSAARMPVNKVEEIPVKPTAKGQSATENATVDNGVEIQLEPERKRSPPKGMPTDQGHVNEIKPKQEPKYSPKSMPLEKGVEIQLKPERKNSPKRKSVEKAVKLPLKQERKKSPPRETSVDQGGDIKQKPARQNRH